MNTQKHITRVLDKFGQSYEVVQIDEDIYFSIIGEAKLSDDRLEATRTNLVIHLSGPNVTIGFEEQRAVFEGKVDHVEEPVPSG